MPIERDGDGDSRTVDCAKRCGRLGGMVSARKSEALQRASRAVAAGLAALETEHRPIENRRRPSKNRDDDGNQDPKRKSRSRGAD
jgi:hypothetical protein